MNKIQNNKTIYELQEGESCIVEDSNLFTTALKVPGGWFYRSYDKSNKIMTGVFIPYPNHYFIDVPPHYSGVTHE